MFKRILSGFLSAALAASMIAASAPQTVFAAASGIAKGDSWSYIRSSDEAETADSSWKKADFDTNSAWKEAKTPIGYGYKAPDPALATDIGKGSGVWHLYAQKKLNIASLDNVNSIHLNIDADDEAKIYVNGELIYHKITASSVNKNVTGLYPDDPQGGSSGDVYLPASSLKAGENLISVDVKNDRLESSDLYFDMLIEPSEKKSETFDGYKYTNLIVSPGADETGLNFAWYTDSNESFSTNYIDAAYNDSKYLVTKGSDGSGFYYNDGNTATVYKIPLDKQKSGGKLGLDVAANYTIDASADGTNYTRVTAAKGGADAADFGKDNRNVESVDIDAYAKGKDFIWVKIGDQTTANGWGGCIYRVYVSYEDNDGDGEVDFASKGKLDPKVQIVKKSEMTNGEMPDPSEQNTFKGYANNAISGKASNKVEVPVESGTEYAYRISADSADKWSEVYYTTTRGGADSYTAIFVGDPQLDSSGEGLQKDTQKWLKTLDLAEKRAEEIGGGAALVLSAGDQVNTGSSESQYMGLTSAPQMQSIPFVPAIGNHDSNDANWTYHYNVPNPTGLGKTGAGSDYYFSYGDTLYVVINMNSDAFAEHEQTMKLAEASHPGARWKIALMHQDIYGSGKQHSLKDSMYKKRMGMYPLFDKYDYDVVLTGHDHTYTRTYIMKGNVAKRDTEVNSEGAAIAPDGTQYITANTSAGKYYDLAPVRGTYAKVRSQYKVPSYSVLGFTDNEFTIRTYRTDTNAVYDSFTICKSATENDLKNLVAEAKKVDPPCDPLFNAINKAERMLAGAPDANQLTDMFKELYNVIPRAKVFDGASLAAVTYDGVESKVVEYDAYDQSSDKLVRDPGKSYIYDHEPLRLEDNVATLGAITATVPYTADLNNLEFAYELDEDSYGASVEHMNTKVTASRFTESVTVTSMRGDYSITYEVTVKKESPKNGLVTENGKQYFYKDNVLQKNTEIEIGGAFFYASDDGSMFINGFAPNGRYYGADGKRGQNRLVDVNGKTYCLDHTGAAVRGVIADGDGIIVYFAGADGAIVKDAKIKIGGGYYRFKPDGHAYRNAFVNEADGRYFYNWDGRLISENSLVKSGRDTYFVAANGRVTANRWFVIGRNKYYAGKGGRVYQNTVKKIGKTTYAFDKRCVMQKGKKLVTVGKYKYYVGKKGAVAKKTIVKVGKKQYYVNAKGRMVKNTRVKYKGKRYKANKKGVLKRIK